MARTKTTFPPIHRLIETARKDRGLSKAAASRELEISRMTYDMWERGAWVPDMDNIDKLALFIDAPKAEVMSALARANGYIDADAYLEVKHGK